MAAPALINRAIDIINSFNPSTHSPDAHIVDVLGTIDEVRFTGVSLQQLPSTSSNFTVPSIQTEDHDKVFLQQVFMGIERRRKFLDVSLAELCFWTHNDYGLAQVFLSTLYHQHGNLLQRSEYTRFMVLSYLLFFRLDELGWKKFRVFVASQDSTAVHLLLGLALDEGRMREWVVETWCQSLDRGYIEANIMQRMERYRHTIGDWLADTRHAAFGSGGGAASSTPSPASSGGGGSQAGGGQRPTHGRRSSKAKRGPTQPAPFNLTVPRPRVLPEPVPIETPAELKPKPVPQTLHSTSLKEVEAAKRERRQRLRQHAAAKYTDATVPKLTESKVDKEALRAQADAKELATLKPHKRKYRPPPGLPEEGADVKLNAAAILREEALFRQRQKAEADRIADYEANLRDASEFNAWQAKQKALDDAAEAAVVEARRAEMAASSAAAVAASEARKQENAELATELRKETELIVQHSKAEKRLAQEAKRELAAGVRAYRQEAPQAAVAKVERSKKAAAEAIKAQRKADEVALAQQRKREAAERADVIRQIQALERAPRKAFGAFDPTTAPVHGLLEEMSLVEMKTRLAQIKAEHKEEREGKRREIGLAKRSKAQGLQDKLATLRRVRSAAATTNRSTRTRQIAAKETAEAQAAEARSHRVVALADRLATKRASTAAAAHRASEVEARSMKEAMFRGAAKRQLEERRFEENLSAQERAIRERQAAAHKAAEKAAAATQSDEVSRSRYIRRNRAAQQSKLQASEQVAQDAALEAADFVSDERTRKKHLFFAQAAREKRLAAVRDANDTYTAAVRSVRQDAARASWGGQDRYETLADTTERRVARLQPEDVQTLGLADTVQRAAASQAAVARRIRGVENPLVAAGLDASAVQNKPGGTLQLAADSSAAGATWRKASATLKRS